jgi:DNA excision repair protein ERCC-3
MKLGVLTAANIKMNTLIICDVDMAVNQWRDELLRWTTIDRENIFKLTSDNKEKSIKKL